jgi:cytochrome c5
LHPDFPSLNYIFEIKSIIIITGGSMTRNNWLITLATALVLTMGCSKEEAPPAVSPTPAPVVEKTAEQAAPKVNMEHVMDKAHEGMTDKTHEAMQTAHEGIKNAHETAIAAMATGQAIYEKTCAACHNTGVAGAPRLGDKAAWAGHLPEGVEHLLQVAIAGEGAMPPRGGNPDLSDDELRAAVIYMLDQSR